MGELNRLLISAESPRDVAQIDLPRSKSICNRLLIMQALSGGKVRITCLSTSDDSILLTDFLKTKTSEKWVGEAGTAFRFGLAWAAVTPGVHIIDGTERLRQRPIKPLVDALRILGADIEFLENDQSVPIRVNGASLKGGEISVEGSMSSQYVTALLLVSPYFQEGLSLKLGVDQVSKPYIEMTVALMRQAGALVDWNDRVIKVEPNPYQSCEIAVEPDWSAASYFYGFKMLNPDLEIKLNSLKSESLQGDSVLISLGKQMGVDTGFKSEGAFLRKQEVTNEPQELDFVNCPDLAQTIAVIAAGTKWPLKLTGLQTLKLKETDRILALKSELEKCGVECRITDNSLTLVKFEKPISTPVINTYKDHRMAMAFAPLAAVFGEIIIEDSEVVSKSFPDYWQQVEKMGFRLTKI